MECEMERRETREESLLERLKPGLKTLLAGGYAGRRFNSRNETVLQAIRSNLDLVEPLTRKSRPGKVVIESRPRVVTINNTGSPTR